MSRVCSICGKKAMSGNKISHSHRKSRRTWGVNVHKVAVTKPNGTIKKEYVCAKCLKTQKKIDNA